MNINKLDTETIPSPLVKPLLNNTYEIVEDVIYKEVVTRLMVPIYLEYFGV